MYMSPGTFLACVLSGSSGSNSTLDEHAKTSKEKTSLIAVCNSCFILFVFFVREVGGRRCVWTLSLKVTISFFFVEETVIMETSSSLPVLADWTKSYD